MEDNGITYEDYEGEDPDFDICDDFQVKEASDPEESWGDEEPSLDSDYSLISEEELAPKSCDISDALTPPIAKKNDSNDSLWEVVSLASVISLSECSANDMAREILEREQDLDGMSEPVLDEKDIDIEPELLKDCIQPPKKKTQKLKKNVRCGIILFRSNGGEILLMRKKKKKTRQLQLISGSMKKKESPLEAAIRCFTEKTGCTNFDRFAILPNLISSRDGKDGKLFMFFTAVVNCQLQFLSSLPEISYEVEWLPTEVACRLKPVVAVNRKKNIDQTIASVVSEAFHLLEANAHSIPTLVDPEIEQLADMAHRDLLDYAQKTNVSVTSAEVRDFLARNQDDLQLMFQDPSDEELKTMLRKCVRQLPMGNKSATAASVDGNLSLDGNLLRLESMVASCTNSVGKVKWSDVNDLLAESPEILCDSQILSILVTCGWDANQQKFGKMKSRVRKEIFNSCLQNCRLVSSAV